jgi:G1/S-specific cyclin PLC1
MSIHPKLPNSLCPTSLVPWSRHNPHLLRILHRRVTHEMVSYVAQQFLLNIPFNESSLAGTTSFHPPHRIPPKDSLAHLLPPSPNLCPLEDFMAHLIGYSHVHVATLFATLIYLQRLKSKLPILANGAPFSFTCCDHVSDVKQGCCTLVIGYFWRYL